MWRHYGHWHHGMHLFRRGCGFPWGWGFHRGPCCCLFFTLPLMLLPFLALAMFIWRVL